MKPKPLTLKEANAFVTGHHRHHGQVQGCKFAIGCEVSSQLVGVALCGRPVSRHLDDGTRLEVNRLCSDGTKNVCSFLYSRCARIAREMGYKEIITYILPTEDGTSLQASGWEFDGFAQPPVWKSKGRENRQQPNPVRKLRYKKCLSV